MPHFISDLHLGSSATARKRGFGSVEEHDDAIMDDILQRVNTKRDILYILGDIAMTNTALQRLREIPGRKFMVHGNHDKFQTGQYLSIFENVYGAIRYKRIWLTHIPIHPQEMLLGPKVIGNMHGHIHRDGITGNLGFPWLNACWDFVRYPISLDDAKRWFEMKGETDLIPQ